MDFYILNVHCTDNTNIKFNIAIFTLHVHVNYFHIIVFLLVFVYYIQFYIHEINIT